MLDRMLPKLTIIGRPNVGKSSLFNRRAGRRISIVDPTPGVTRDRIAAEILLKPSKGPTRAMQVIDTGGWGIYTTEKNRKDDAGVDLTPLTPSIETQITAAAKEADIILFVTDARDDVMALDRTVASLLRRRITIVDYARVNRTKAPSPGRWPGSMSPRQA